MEALTLSPADGLYDLLLTLSDGTVVAQRSVAGTPVTYSSSVVVASGGGARLRSAVVSRASGLPSLYTLDNALLSLRVCVGARLYCLLLGGVGC